MPPVKLTTDMGDWSTLPARIRIALVTGFLAAALVGVLGGLRVVPILVGVALLALLGIIWVVVFDRRRSWWGPEPTLDVDPIGKNATRNVVTFAAAGLMAVLLVALGVGS